MDLNFQRLGPKPNPMSHDPCNIVQVTLHGKVWSVPTQISTPTPISNDFLPSKIGTIQKHNHFHPLVDLKMESCDFFDSKVVYGVPKWLCPRCVLVKTIVSLFAATQSRKYNLIIFKSVDLKMDWKMDLNLRIMKPTRKHSRLSVKRVGMIFTPQVDRMAAQWVSLSQTLDLIWKLSQSQYFLYAPYFFS